MASCLYHICQRKWHVIFLIFSILTFATVTAQECSATKLCATGCCSSFGFCGTDDAHCGTGCLSTCNYKLGCDAHNPCAAGTGCCSKFGFCGLGPDCTFCILPTPLSCVFPILISFCTDCAPGICVANCDSKSYCDPGYGASGYSEVEACPLNVCCSKCVFHTPSVEIFLTWDRWGFCGLTEEFCGNKTVTRPSCSSSSAIQRVVG
jgi:hypothetical protein